MNLKKIGFDEISNWLKALIMDYGFSIETLSNDLFLTREQILWLQMENWIFSQMKIWIRAVFSIKWLPCISAPRRIKT